MEDDEIHPLTARARSQHEPLIANPAFPHWGRDSLDHGHAIFAVSSHLRTLALEDWTARVVRWLSNYDGFERWVDEGHDPCMCVRDLLASYVGRWRDLSSSRQDRVGSSFEASQLKHQIVSDLMKLNFVRYRAFWGRDQVPDETARVWNPLAQPWLSFVESGLPEEGLVVFEATQKLHPPLHAHSSFLLEP